MKLSTFSLKFTAKCKTVFFTLARNEVTREYNAVQLIEAYTLIQQTGH